MVQGGDSMKLMFHVLKKSNKLGIDNTKLGLSGILEKLNEEKAEVIQASANYYSNRSLHNLKEIIREVYDLIQVCILLLFYCKKEAVKKHELTLLNDINIEHKDKLVNRGWEIITGIEVDVKE